MVGFDVSLIFSRMHRNSLLHTRIDTSLYRLDNSIYKVSFLNSLSRAERMQRSDKVPEDRLQVLRQGPSIG